MAQEPHPVDPAAIIGGLSQLLGWAGQTIVGPHASHVDPGGHPECLICRGILAMQSLGLDSLADQMAWDLDSDKDVTANVTFVGDDEDVRWIPVVREHL